MPSTWVPSSDVQRYGLPWGRSRSVNSWLKAVRARPCPSWSGRSARYTSGTLQRRVDEGHARGVPGRRDGAVGAGPAGKLVEDRVWVRLPVELHFRAPPCRGQDASIGLQVVTADRAVKLGRPAPGLARIGVDPVEAL